jgi:HAE1 family hydrophobic/amphiphilic exporter-1
VPTFYDSIEISRDRAFAKFHRRETQWSGTRFNSLLAFVATLVEGLLTVLLVRFVYRLAKRLFGRMKRPGGRGGRPASISVQGD